MLGETPVIFLKTREKYCEVSNPVTAAIFWMDSLVEDSSCFAFLIFSCEIYSDRLVPVNCLNSREI